MGFTNGFEIGYEGPANRTQRARNHPLTCFNKMILWNKIFKEVNLKRVAGPFKHIPFDTYIQSPAGLVPKQSSSDKPGDNTCLIFHLSWPEKSSLNFYTPKEKCSVKYKDLDQAVRLCMKIGQGCYLAKSDMKSAFHNLSIRKEDWGWLILMAYHPVTNEKFFFREKCLPFVSDAIQHILQYRTRKEAINCLDDFLFAALVELVCNNLVRSFSEICGIDILTYGEEICGISQ